QGLSASLAPRRISPRRAESREGAVAERRRSLPRLRDLAAEVVVQRHRPLLENLDRPGWIAAGPRAQEEDELGEGVLVPLVGIVGLGRRPDGGHGPVGARDDRALRSQRGSELESRRL